MNDNRKSVLEQALDAVRAGNEMDDLGEVEFRELLGEFRAKLDEKGYLTGTLPH